MNHKTLQSAVFRSIIEAYAFRYDLKQQKIKSYWSVDMNGVYTVSYKI